MKNAFKWHFQILLFGEVTSANAHQIYDEIWSEFHRDDYGS